jgi:pSer/pThr/pTyr-binding forkhead associated (FHA) protein
VQCGLDGKFSPPDWVASPPPKFEHAHLRVIKDGTLVSRIALGKRAFVLVGRVATCDVVAEHRSISRQHAVVGWDALGTLYVQDLDTNWGTFVDDAKAYNPTHSFAATQRNATQRNTTQNQRKINAKSTQRNAKSTQRNAKSTQNQSNATQRLVFVHRCYYHCGNQRRSLCD